MTGPASGGIERGTGAPSRSTGTQGAVGAVLVVLALGLALRLIIAYLAPRVRLRGRPERLPVLGGQPRRRTASAGSTSATSSTTTRPATCTSCGSSGSSATPWAAGVGDLIKIPAILGRRSWRLLGWLVWSMVRELGGRDRLALARRRSSPSSTRSPGSTASVWGQVDSFGVVFLLLGLRELWRDRPERAAIFTVIAALIKPQLGDPDPDRGGRDDPARPVAARRPGRRARAPSSPRRRDAGPVPGLGARHGRPVRIVTTGLVGVRHAVVPRLPAVRPVGRVVLDGGAVCHSRGCSSRSSRPPAATRTSTVNAYNLWALVTGDTGLQPRRLDGLWVCDGPWIATQVRLGRRDDRPVSRRSSVGTALLLAVIVLIAAVVWRRPDRLTILLGLTVLALRLLRGPDPRPRALRLPVLPARDHHRGRLVALADRLRRRVGRRRS